jgi:isoleucyl-tRNA synthetase
MKFKQGTRRKAIEYEKDLIQQWRKNKTFEKSVENRPKSNAYVFYDGPPFLTGLPHHGHLLGSTIKDAVARYWTMKGKRVERAWGWDCHGLPAEVFTEKKLGIADRRDIGTKISLEEYIVTCRDNMVQTGTEWEDTIARIGRWVDMGTAYKTMDKDYMESVWWAFKTLYEKGKIYEGERVLMYCTRDATPLSKAEVTMDTGAYQEVTDPSVYVKFKLKDWDSSEPVYVLAWTTTPWTLPANTAVAVHRGLDYAEVEVGGERLILATDLLDKVLTDERHKVLDYKLIKTFKGKDLIGKSYEPLDEDRGKKAHKIWHADYVSLETGSGVVHLSPAYGEEDFELAKVHDVPVVHVIDENGLYDQTEWKGHNVWEINKTIAKTLHERGTVWKIDYYRHTYPHCHRCGTRLMYRAHPSWFMDIDGQREKMLIENTENINWFPEHIKHGRFEKTVQAAPDWNLSRDRFWATAMPVWEGFDKDGKKHQKVVGSYAELKELSGAELDDYHRPWVDDITFKIDGVEYKRIEKVLDCWFESGSMPFAQFHYPFENVSTFEQNYPGDFITEYVGQVRAWFYYVHAVNVALFGTSAFKNVIVTGNLAGNDGRKMSKSYGNYTDPNELMDQYSADSLRFLLLSSPLLNAEDFALQNKDVADVARKLAMIWNMYDFFTMYADVDGWEWDGNTADPSESLSNPLDQWIISRTHQLCNETDTHMQRYDIPNALKPMLEFIDDASNWYVRRSRRRFWKSGDDTDKNDAYRTLHYVLVSLSMVTAPFTPFLAEELYQKLTGGESVHLLDWPETGHINELVIERMEDTRKIVNESLAKRSLEGLKVRQPLKKVDISIAGAGAQLEPEYVEIIKEEINVKEVVLSYSEAATAKKSIVINLDTALTPELKREGMMREVVRHVQSSRKQAGLNVDDRISLLLETTDKELSKAIEDYMETIKQETLAKSINQTKSQDFVTAVNIEDAELTIALQKTA